MTTIDQFKALVGKQITANITQGWSVPLTVDQVDALPAPETDEEAVRKDPFSVLLSGPLDNRVPSGSYPISGEGLSDDAVAFIDPLADLNPDDDKLPYEAVFA